ncbi:EboA domain-containing protein [Mucilaginibacter sp. FT3.2]|uniref:EboA domain-containing protein n=1 Tax=Mucilaginibacter sp. FT3.2 TaxID=2723090 RepID=UPI00160E91AD|nr:EboA domain-containing protein [Mucilaginibacter sp. FT3.2]MBB6232902.1 hypothetical protein [Mucilaginibacter sp. FT3.2]
MFNYDVNNLREGLSVVIQRNISADAFQWLQGHQVVDQLSFVKGAFVQMPRRVGKAKVVFSEAESQQLKHIRPGFTIDEWTTDRLCRVYLLVTKGSEEKDKNYQLIEDLFSAAEMNEQVALYSALPVLPFPELWGKRCAEGIRSNIGSVLEAIMYQNPYPAEQLDEAAWNQMVIKAFFTEKQISQIQGLDERANKELARILTDYARERQAAGRGVDPMLWYLVAKFVDEPVLDAMKRGFF